MADDNTNVDEQPGNAGGGDKDPKIDDGDNGVQSTGKSDHDDKLSGGNKLDIEELLDEYGLDSPDELKEFVSGLAEMRGKIGDTDLDTLLENTKTLQQYQENWKAQEEEKRRESETPEQTIARLEKEKKDLQKQNMTQAQRQQAAKAAERALSEFNDTIETVIAGAESLPKEYQNFARKFMGVNNPMNEVDITDRAAVRRVGKANLKEFAKFEQAVIKNYLAGKTKIPKVTTTEPAPGSTGDSARANPKNLKEAKRIMMESVGAFVKR